VGAFRRACGVDGCCWLPTLLVAGATAALIGTGTKTEPYFRQTDAFQDTNRALGGTVTGAIIAAVPSAFYVASLLRKDSYRQGTSLLAGEAVAADAVSMIVAKAITRRLRPSDIPVNGNYNDTFSKIITARWAPAAASGYAMMSFSVAKVFCAAVPAASMGSLGGLWRGHGDRLLSADVGGTLPFGCVVPGGYRLRDRAV
jgi:hypothetical protein